MLARIKLVKPLSLTMPTSAASAVSIPARLAIENHLDHQRRRLVSQVHSYARWLANGNGSRASSQLQQRKLTVLRLKFTAALDQFDIFADAFIQRGEQQLGTWLAGLDVAAADALRLPQSFDTLPPIVTYLDRGHGAAIRRVRTRLPGGGENPAAIIRVPRERMLSSGVAGSLVHEVGHQAAALLGLVDSLRKSLLFRVESSGDLRPAWIHWKQWISEIVADFWAIAKLGVAATVGLIGVMSLPRAFVFRMPNKDPHPFPWIRVQLNLHLGRALFPDPQWHKLSELWRAMYPLSDLRPAMRITIERLKATLSDFVHELLNHRPPSLGGRMLYEIMPLAQRSPARLRASFHRWRSNPRQMYKATPTKVFAVFGQARWDGTIDPDRETALLTDLLSHWALRRSKGTSHVSGSCACSHACSGAA